MKVKTILLVAGFALAFAAYDHFRAGAVIASGATALLVLHLLRRLAQADVRPDASRSLTNDPRKQPENELASQLDFLQVLLDTIPSPVFYKDSGGKYLGCNRAFEQYLGISTKEIIGKTVYDLAPPELADSYAEMDRALFSQAGIQVYESSVVYADGSRHEVIFNKATFTRKDGATGGLVGVILDVTEQKRAQQSLRELQMKQQAILNNIPDLVWMKDSLSRYLIVNKAFAGRCGLDEDEVVGKTDFDIWPEPMATTYRRGDIEVMCTGRQTLVEEILTDHQGNEVWIETHKMPIRNGRGEVIGTTGISRNIHQRKLAEEALRESEERFHQIFAQNEDAIILFRVGTFDVLDANPAALDLYGFNRSDLAASTISSFIAPHDFDQLVETIPLDDCSRNFQLDAAKGKKRSGEEIIIALRGKVLKLRSQLVLYCSIRDITEKTRLEEEIRATQAKLIHANKMTSLGILASSIAHEINNPNNYISVNANLLVEAWEDAAPILAGFHREHGDYSLGGLPYSEMVQLAPRLFTGITEGSRRITTIIDNMKDFVRTDKGTHGTVDINQTLHDAATILWNHIQRFTDHFRLELCDSPPPVRGNRQQIEQVLINLVTNGLQALPDKSRAVVVSTAVDPARKVIVVTVRDEGDGMEKAVLDRVTEPFFSTRMGEGGTGLGLYISASIVKEHRGELQFLSAPGEGTTAIITLPLA